VYAPEHDQPGGQETRQFVVDWKTTAPPIDWPFIVTTARVKGDGHEDMTFTRYLATITTIDGSKNLNADVAGFIAAQGYGHGIGYKAA